MHSLRAPKSATLTLITRPEAPARAPVAYTRRTIWTFTDFGPILPHVTTRRADVRTRRARRFIRFLLKRPVTAPSTDTCADHHRPSPLAPHQVTEVSSPSAHEFADAAEVSTFTRSQLLLAEKALLRELGYSLYHPTSSSFAGAYLSRLVPGLRKAGLMAPKAASVNTAGARNTNAASAYNPGDWNTDPCEDVSEIVDYLLEASMVAHGSLQFAPSAVATAAVSYTLEKMWNVRWDAMNELHVMSGYTRKDLTKVYAFFDHLISDAYDAEECGRGLHVNDKFQNATSILWRKAFFTTSTHGHFDRE